MCKGKWEGVTKKCVKTKLRNKKFVSVEGKLHMNTWEFLIFIGSSFLCYCLLLQNTTHRAELQILYRLLWLLFRTIPSATIKDAPELPRVTSPRL